MSPAETSTVASPGLEGEIAAETETAASVTNFNSELEDNIVPAGRLIAEAVPF